MATYKVLIMGASYGSLLATKLLFAGNSVKLVCLPAEVEAFNTEGARVRIPIKGRTDPVEIDSRALPGHLSADGPGAVNPSGACDLIAWRCRNRNTAPLVCASCWMRWRCPRFPACRS